MCRAFGREELIEDERFKTATARGENVVERREVMSAEIGKWPSAEILARLDREGVPCAPVLNRYEVIEDAQVRENDLIEVREDPLLRRSARSRRPLGLTTPPFSPSSATIWTKSPP
jgi:crotonobetainyl-CoA:carnitine CoA-transferase CaiB-like acyl-CoA transferase